ncbi:MAG: hypothetical protein PHX61_05505 [Alphaproteobacteria bacterium]|nr:hypothetical protein [Alphaproteobacteria bacterium]OIN85661.1 MAG: hypothetical protein AUJ12_08950 [Alphaproteobacteria bacterium CG1_02_46_17]
MRNTYNNAVSGDLNIIEKFSLAVNSAAGLYHLTMTQPRMIGAAVGVLVLGATAYGYLAKRSRTIG